MLTMLNYKLKILNQNVKWVKTLWRSNAYLFSDFYTLWGYDWQTIFKILPMSVCSWTKSKLPPSFSSIVLIYMLLNKMRLLSSTWLPLYANCYNGFYILTPIFLYFLCIMLLQANNQQLAHWYWMQNPLCHLT